MLGCSSAGTGSHCLKVEEQGPALIKSVSSDGLQWTAVLLYQDGVVRGHSYTRTTSVEGP